VVWAFTAPSRAILSRRIRFDLAVSQLGSDDPGACQRCAGSVLGDGVALARHAPGSSTRWTGGFDGWVAVAAQEPGQADAVGAAALDGEQVESAPCVGPGEQFGVAVVGGGDRQVAEAASEAVDGDGDVGVFVGVDADDDVVAFKCEASHGCCSLHGSTVEARWPVGKDRTAMGPGSIRLL